MTNDSNLIYKYTPHNKRHKYDIIKKNELWFAEFNSLNDPLDLNLAFKSKYSNDEIRAYWESESHKNPKQNLTENLKKYGNNENFVKYQRQKFRALKSLIGILCMTTNPKNILMWAHYANGHKGVVYEFDENLFQNSKNEDLQKMPLYMKYISSYEPLSYIPQNGENKLLQFTKSLQMKAQDWEYEREVRFFNMGTSGIAINFNPTSLKTIIFGERTPKGEIRKTISFCQDNHSLNHIHFKQAKFIDGKFKLRLETLNPKDFK